MADVEDAEEETLVSQRGSLSLRESMWDVMDVKQEEVDEEEAEDEEEVAVGPGRGSQSQRESPGGSQQEHLTAANYVTWNLEKHQQLQQLQQL
eukprot:gene26717-4286_t